MTRFWITLDEAVDFVFSCFPRMVGGEIFIPKIPSIKIVDLAKAMDKKKIHKIIGIRSGEKLHEKMISANESHLTLDYKNYYIIRPSINFEKRVDYKKNNLGEKGKKVIENFEYSSDKNPNFLSIEKIKKINKKEGF
jgi:UDP-N-acetylglucosamine 4,6-dehydratase